MLPSTGYFKTINCPFYESGSCERPYCHFKHARREDAGSTAGVAGSVEAQAMGQTQGAKATSTATPNSDMLQQLVTEAVKKVLADQEVTDTEKVSQNIVSQVVEGLKPTLASSSPAVAMETAAPNIIGKHISIPTPITKPVPCVYNPTPISELKKRHIPVVSYMPTRESRVAVKRKPSPERIKPWLGVVQEANGSQMTEVTYKPTAIVNTNEQDSVQNYVPTFKSDSSSNSYEDSNSNDYLSKINEPYYPKSKKRREEYVPKKVKAPLKTVQNVDDSAVDQFESEFDMIDEILTDSQVTKATILSFAAEDSEDYFLGIEPKFSDDEPMEDTCEDYAKETEKYDNQETEKTEYLNEKENEGMHHTETHNKDKIDADSEKCNNHYKAKSNDAKENNKSKSRDNHQESDSKDKHKEQIKNNRHDERHKKESKSSSKIDSKDKKEHSSSERSSKDKSRHKSDSRDRRHSSSSRDKDRSKDRHSSKDSSHKSREHSESSRSKDSSGKKDRKDRHKSSRHDRHKSKSSSSRPRSEKRESSEKHESSKSHKKHHSSSSRSSKHRGSSTDRDSYDHEDRSSSPEIATSFVNDLLETSDSDHDVQEECLKIFQEYQPSDHPKVVSIKEPSKPGHEELEEVGRKRVAHPSAATSVTKPIGPSQPVKKIQNPQQKMYERWRLMREAAAEKAAEKAAANAKTQVTSGSAPQSSASTHDDSVDTATSYSESQFNGNGRIRIAHVPYAMSLAMEKKKITETVAKVADNKVSDVKTAAQTAKSGQRVAHVPQAVPQLIRPEPLQVATQKFPLNVRQYYVNLMHDICVQIYTTAEDAAQRALREELACHDKCKALVVYKNSCMLAAHRLRKEVDQKVSDNSVASGSGMMSHEAVLAGKSRGSWSVVKTKRSLLDIKGTTLYNMLKKWILTEQQLRDNGFPRPHPEGPKGRAKIYVTNSRNQNSVSKVPNERICSRCGQSYMVDKHGFPLEQQNCIYHWGRKFTVRGEGKYSCCQQYGSATGCCDAKNHVWDYTDYENLRGYVKTLPKDVPVEEQGVYSLDCEMCYTTQGLELTRITVINEECNVIYETLVKPQNPIIDYNTRFSGITEENMKDVTTTLLDVQATLLMMFSDKTVLVGHSLESDFKALRLLHDTVVDTSVMFPHRNGYPQKRALKNLCSEYLRKLIQNDVGGHDSKEDAVSCMELVLWKVKEEAKLQ